MKKADLTISRFQLGLHVSLNMYAYVDHMYAHNVAFS